MKSAFDVLPGRSSNRLRCFCAGAVMLLAVPCLLAAAPAGGAAGVDPGGQVSPDLHEINSETYGTHARAAKVMLILFQVASMLAAAKLLGWAAERVKIPGVIGELMAGVVLGPFLLGHIIQVPLGGGHWVELFPDPTGPGQWPVNDVVWTFAQFASVILLFVTGLHTDLQQFLKYVGPATLVAVAGLLVPFGLGAGVVYIPMFSELARGAPGESVGISALFVGTILAATSIGITARVLSDIGKLDTPEGVTILGAAVLDDVLGIIALAIVGGLAAVGSVDAATVGGIAGKALGFWIGLTVVALLLSRPIEWALLRIKYSGAAVGLGLALAFVCSGAAESFGLAFIIGAYSVGLGLSRTKHLAHKLMEDLEPISHFVVPIFFAALGMLVNIQAMLASWEVIIFGLVVTAAAIVGKLIGCGVAALPGGFNLRGAYRIGLGMLPRGEVALIVAGIGLSQRIIGDVVFGVSIMMTLITTIVAPILLVPAFRGGSGRSKPEERAAGLPGPSALPAFEVRVPEGLVAMYLKRLVDAAESSGWTTSYDQAEDDIYLLRSDSDAAQVSRVDTERIRVDASDVRQQELVGLAQGVRERLIEDVSQVAVTTPLPPTVGAEVPGPAAGAAQM